MENIEMQENKPSDKKKFKFFGEYKWESRLFWISSIVLIALSIAVWNNVWQQFRDYPLIMAGLLMNAGYLSEIRYKMFSDIRNY